MPKKNSEESQLPPDPEELLLQDLNAIVLKMTPEQLAKAQEMIANAQASQTADQQPPTENPTQIEEPQSETITSIKNETTHLENDKSGQQGYSDEEIKEDLFADEKTKYLLLANFTKQCEEIISNAPIYKIGEFLTNLKTANLLPWIKGEITRRINEMINAKVSEYYKKILQIYNKMRPKEKRFPMPEGYNPNNEITSFLLDTMPQGFNLTDYKSFLFNLSYLNQQFTQYIQENEGIQGLLKLDAVLNNIVRVINQSLNISRKANNTLKELQPNLHQQQAYMEPELIYVENWIKRIMSALSKNILILKQMQASIPAIYLEQCGLNELPANILEIHDSYETREDYLRRHNPTYD